MWDIIGLIEEIYSSFVLGIHSQHLQVTANCPGSNSTVPFHSDAPRQLLLSPLVGVSVEYLQSMEAQLIDSKVWPHHPDRHLIYLFHSQGKKRRRDLFKDLVKNIAATYKANNSNTENSKKILDLQNDGQGRGMQMYVSPLLLPSPPLPNSSGIVNRRNLTA